ncbi:MAG: protein phosphatase 2C domain-containing protein [Muribaculaceae bacterium]|nr:protein phosphatase 2C domain-containing protein [Muribaculaceae bacterium]
MNRSQRHLSRLANRRGPIHDLERIFDAVTEEAALNPAEREAFCRWALSSLLDNFKTHLMDRRIEIEKQIKAMGINVPNGTVNKDYHASFLLPEGLVSDVRVDGVEDLGLSLTTDGYDEYYLSGRPVKAGDFTLTLSFQTLAGAPRSSLKIPVAFNPDPRSLWRNIPTDPNIPYFKEDSATDYIRVEAGKDEAPRKDMVAASQRGRSHAREGKPRDDHFALDHCYESGWYIMAVADGAGSAKYSRKGSEVACNAAVAHCKSMLTDNPEFEKAIADYAADKEDAGKRTELTRMVIDIIYKGAVKAHEAVKKVAAANEEAKLRDFATTLMFAIAKKYDFGWFIASFWVGDGAICLFDMNSHTVKLLGTPDEGEFSGQTRFLTMPEIFHDKDVVSKRLKMTIVPDFTALFLMTDGVSDPMFETEKNLNDYDKWLHLWNKLNTGFPGDNIPGVDLSDDNEQSKNQLLRWLDFWSAGNHDDRTIAILY